VAVRDEKALGVGREPGHGRARKPRQGDDALDLEYLVPRREPEAPLPEDLSLRAGVDGDSGLGEQTGDLARRVGTEERER
jgi:hypothetical protein